MKAKQDLHVVPQKAGEAGCLPHSSFPGERNSSYLGNSLLPLSNADVGDGMMQEKMKLSSFHLMHLFLGLLFQCVAKIS